MKSSLILGFIFLILGGVLGYIQYKDSTDFLTLTLITGILIGAVLGLLFGALGGYNSKAQSVKRKTRAQQEIRTKTEENTSSSDSSQV